MKKILVLICIALVASMGAFAQTDTSVASRKKAQKIVDKYIEVIGGKETLGKAKNWKFAGEVKIGNIDAFTKYFIKYDKIRMDISVMGQTITKAYDGTDAWELNPMKNSGKPRYSLGDKLNSIEYLNLILPMYLIGKNREHVVYDSTDTWNNQKTHVLHCYEGVYKSTYFFAQKTGLLVKRQTFSMITEFFDYESDKKTGLLIPQKVTIKKEDGSGVFKQIEVNPELSDSIFKLTGKIEYETNNYNKLVALGEKLAPDNKLSIKKIVGRYENVYRNLNSGVSSIQMVGSFFFNKSTHGYPMQLIIKRNKQRIEIEMGKKRMVMANNGKVKWELNPFVSPKPRLKKDDSESLSFAFSDVDLINYKQRGHKIKYLSRIYIGNILCHELELTKKTGEISYIYLDVKTYSSIKTMDKSSGEAMYFMKHQLQQKRLLPTIVYIVYSAGQHIIFKLDKYTFDQPINDKIFEFPGKDKKK